MQFTKIKFNSEGVALEWKTPAENAKLGEKVHHRLVSENEPVKSFIDALASLRAMVGEILAVPDEWAEGLRVIGCSINYEDDGRRGFVITALKDLEATNSPCVINTPHLREDDHSGEQGGKFADESLVFRVQALCSEAAKYVQGERAQLALDLDGDEEEQEPAEAGATK